MRASVLADLGPRNCLAAQLRAPSRGACRAAGERTAGLMCPAGSDHCGQPRHACARPPPVTACRPCSRGDGATPLVKRSRRPAAQVKKEIVGSRDKIASCGVPHSKVVGFRTPFLSDSPTVRQVLADYGFR